MQTRWEYMSLESRESVGLLSGSTFDAGQLTARLNSHGEHGWELVSLLDVERRKAGLKTVVAILKRPKLETS